MFAGVRRWTWRSGTSWGTSSPGQLAEVQHVVASFRSSMWGSVATEGDRVSERSTRRITPVSAAAMAGSCCGDVSYQLMSAMASARSRYGRFVPLARITIPWSSSA